MCPYMVKRILCKGSKRASEGRTGLLCWETEAAVHSVLLDWACPGPGGDGVRDLEDHDKELAFGCLTFLWRQFQNYWSVTRVVQELSAAHFGCKLPGWPVNIPFTWVTTRVYLWCVPIACSLNSENKLHTSCLFTLKMQWRSHTVTPHPPHWIYHWLVALHCWFVGRLSGHLY